MIRRDVDIVNRLGLHARAAAKLVQVASGFQADVILEKDGQEADAKSILNVLLLAAAQGSRVGVTCDGDDEQQALEAVVDLIDSRFGEEA
ncbi:MAG: HPr family phosphocarrier protein [Acidobacteriota bacterium]